MGVHVSVDVSVLEHTENELTRLLATAEVDYTDILGRFESGCYGDRESVVQACRALIESAEKMDQLQTLKQRLRGLS